VSKHTGKNTLSYFICIVSIHDIFFVTGDFFEISRNGAWQHCLSTLLYILCYICFAVLAQYN